MLNWAQPFGSARHNIFCYMLYEIIAQPWFRVGMRLRCAGVLLPVGPVPVHCRVGQRSAVLWRQIAVGCWSTNHSDPKQFPGVLQGDNHRVILSQQAEVGRLRVSVAPPGMSQHQGLLPGPPFFFFKVLVCRRAGSLSPLDMSTMGVNNTLLGPEVCTGKAAA